MAYILNAMTSLNGFRPRMQTPFDRLAQQMEDVIGDGGILKEVIQSGGGPPAPANASVLAMFSGFQEYSDQPFVSNVNHQHPRMMKLGKDVTLRGLDLGLMTMKKGEFSRFLFTPEYAYGPMGCPPIIPPAARVLFEVELHDFLDMTAVDDFMELPLVERKDVPLSTVLAVVDTVRNCGNRSYTRKHYFEAKDDYKQALKILLHRDAASDAQAVRKALFPVYNNLALTELQLNSPKKALKYGTKALEINPDSAKALYRCAQACMELQDYESAYSHLIKAQKVKPFDVDINTLLRKVAIHYQEGMEQLKSVCVKMFKTCQIEPGPEKKM